MSICRKSCFLVSVVLLGLTLGACEKKEGSAEQAGRQVDKAAEQAGQAMDKAKENVTQSAK
jgi:hypothetical protein